MSRAFVKEDSSVAGDELVEHPISDELNYVTAAGLQHLQQEFDRLEALRLELSQNKDDSFTAQLLAEAARDQRYFAARLESAILVDTSVHPQDEIRFGAIVSVKDETGQPLEFAIVGEDEAEIAQHKVSWASPLAKALMGHKVGETVNWKRPAGNEDIEVTAIRYSI